MSMDITRCVKEFYSLEVLATLMKVDEFKKSHQKWLADFNEYRNEYINHFEMAIYDYTVMVVGGEMRHGNNHSSHKNPHIKQGCGRSEMYKEIRRFTPESVLTAGVHLFSQSWGGGFGGEPWKNIAQAGLDRNKYGKVAFIDHCIDLSHNSSPYFDKTQSNIFCLWSTQDYKDYLSFKRYAETTELLRRNNLSKYTMRLYDRAVTLSIIEAVGSIYLDDNLTEAVDFIMNYNGIEWGSEVLKNELVKSGHLIGEDDDDENSEEDGGTVDEEEEEEEGNPEPSGVWHTEYEYEPIACNR